jgi:ABC-2 type transport system ATP-binding protein
VDLLQGTLEELKRMCCPEYEIKFRDWDSSGLELPIDVELLSRTATSLKVRVERPQESNPLILKALSEKSASVMAFQEGPRSLEQVYLKVMAEAKGFENVQ